MGRKNEMKKVSFSRPQGKLIETKEVEVEIVTWEKLDRVDDVKAAFSL